MDEETKRANENAREIQKKRVVSMLWDHGWTVEEIAMALSISKKKIREWKDERIKKWGE